jgi:hypothetical protein
MAYIILRTYLSPDIVDYCIVPYLLPSENDIDKARYNLQFDIRNMIVVMRILNIISLKYDFSPSTIKQQYVEFR